MAWSKRIPPQERSADAGAAKEKALDLLCGRDFSCQDLYEHLCRRFTDSTSAGAVAEMLRCGYLDDARYAANKGRMLLEQHKSRRAIAEALRRKGIEKELIADTLETLYQQEENLPDPEQQAALILIKSRYQRKLAEGREDLVLAALARRGFSYRTAKAALEQIKNPDEQYE